GWASTENKEATTMRKMILALTAAALLSGCATAPQPAEPIARQSIEEVNQAAREIKKRAADAERARIDKVPEELKGMNPKTLSLMDAEMRASVAQGIRNCRQKGEPKIGMNESEVRATCWHGPQHVNETITALHRRKQMVYIEGYVYL